MRLSTFCGLRRDQEQEGYLIFDTQYDPFEEKHSISEKDHYSNLAGFRKNHEK